MKKQGTKENEKTTYQSTYCYLVIYSIIFFGDNVIYRNSAYSQHKQIQITF